MREYYNLLTLLNLALNQSDYTEDKIKEEIDKLNLDEAEWEKLLALSVDNSVTGLLYDILYEYDILSGEAKNTLQHYAQFACKINYRYLVLVVQINRLFKKAAIPFCILKGMAAGVDYPVPDVRKVSDLDILLVSPKDIKRAEKLLVTLGFHTDEEQTSLRHIEMRDEKNIKVELHTMLAEPFDNAKTNNYLEKLLPECSKNIIIKEVLGTSLPVLNDAYHVYELLMHMLQHFLHAGIGVRMLCDWVVFWNREIDEKNRRLYIKLVKESKVKGFSDTITRVCIKYLGLKREKVRWMKLYDNNKSREEYEEETEAFVKDAMEAGEFGKVKGRMVAFRGNGVFDYVREFHHQMNINFPKLGKIPVFWPILWIITLIKFLYNNKKLRSVSSREIFESAKKRGKLVKSMNLFK